MSKSARQELHLCSKYICVARYVCTYLFHRYKNDVQLGPATITYKESSFIFDIFYRTATMETFRSMTLIKNFVKIQVGINLSWKLNPMGQCWNSITVFTLFVCAYVTIVDDASRCVTMRRRYASIPRRAGARARQKTTARSIIHRVANSH